MLFINAAKVIDGHELHMADTQLFQIVQTELLAVNDWRFAQRGKLPRTGEANFFLHREIADAHFINDSFCRIQLCFCSFDRLFNLF